MKETGYWDGLRPRYLLSGLMRCWVCGGGFINLNADPVGCAAARAKGTRSNLQTMLRDTLDELVLGGLRNRLMDPSSPRCSAKNISKLWW